MWKHVQYHQGDNTVSVAQGGTANPGATKWLLSLDRVFKRNKYPVLWQKYLNVLQLVLTYEHIRFGICVPKHISKNNKNDSEQKTEYISTYILIKYQYIFV